MSGTRWYRTADTNSPVVVILGWIWAKEDAVNKYAELYNSLGFDVLVYYPDLISLWIPQRASHHAAAVLSLIAQELTATGPRPLFFAPFSGAAKTCYYKILQMLATPGTSAEAQARSKLILSCCAGQIFDSGPVDFTSEAGVKLFNAGSSGGVAAAVLHGASSAAAGTLDFFLLEAFERERSSMWDTLAHCPVRGPVLMLYSLDDQLADPARVRDLAVALRAKGRQVIEQVWQHSPHVGHLKTHPKQYKEAVQHFLELAVQQYNAQHAVAAKASSMASMSPPALQQPAAAAPAAAPSLQMAAAEGRCGTYTMSWQGPATCDLPVTFHRRCSCAEQLLSASRPPAAPRAAPRPQFGPQEGITTHRRIQDASATGAAVLAGSLAAEVLRCGPAADSRGGSPSAASAGVTTHQRVGRRGISAGASGAASGAGLETERGSSRAVSWPPGSPSAALDGSEDGGMSHVVNPAAVAAVFRAQVLTGARRQACEVQGVRLDGAVFGTADELECELAAAGQPVVRLQIRSRL